MRRVYASLKAEPRGSLEIKSLSVDLEDSLLAGVNNIA